MIPSLRSEFNERWTPNAYAQMKTMLEQAAGSPVPFRLAETPIFLPPEFVERAGRLAEEILIRAASDELQQIGKAAVPTDFNYASDATHPTFAAVDFAITGSREAPELKLIELQGFPSLFHFQAAYSQIAPIAYGLEGEFTGLVNSSMTYERYYEILKDLIIAGNDPKEVILMELGPYNQKTLPDFILAHKHLGLAIVDIGDITVKGKDLFYTDTSGKLCPIKRIYNRSIQDEIVSKGARISFDIRNPYNVTWAGHPNWYFRISKVLLPALAGTNEAVPEAFLLSDANLATIDLGRYVLKPLYSFAGAGVIISPTREDVDAISTYARHQWLLQERVTYIDAIESPTGLGIKAELRILLGWGDKQPKPQALHTLVRLTRGTMIGVDQNRGLEWVGSSCALIPR